MNLELDLERWGTDADTAAPPISLDEIAARAAEPVGDVVFLTPSRAGRRPHLLTVAVVGLAAAVAVGVFLVGRPRDSAGPVATDVPAVTTTAPSGTTSSEPRADGFDPRWLPTELPDGWSVAGAYRSEAATDDRPEINNAWTFPDGRTAVFFEGAEGLVGLTPPGDLADVVVDNGVKLLLGGWPNDRLAMVRGFPDADGRRRMVLSDSVSESELAALLAGTSELTVTSTPIDTSVSATVWLRGPNDELTRISVVPPGPGMRLAGVVWQEVARVLGGEATLRQTPEAVFIAWAPGDVAAAVLESMEPSDPTTWDELEQSFDPSNLVPEPPTTVERQSAQVPTSTGQPLEVVFDPQGGYLVLHSEAYGDAALTGVTVWQRGRIASDEADPFTTRTIVAVFPAGTVRVEGEVGDGTVIGGGTGSVVVVPGTDQVVGALDGPIGQPVRAVIGYDAAGNVTVRHGRPPLAGASGG